MVVLLDTDQLTEPERAEALDSAYRSQSPQGAVQIDNSSIRHRLERLDFGPETHLLRRTGSPLRIVRTERHVRRDQPEYVAVELHRRGETVLSSGNVDTELQSGDLSCIDLTRPCSVAHHTWNSHEVLIVSNQQAGVSVDLVRAAGPAPRSSPLYDLVRRHIAGLFDATRDLSNQPRLLTNQATIVLIRALLATAAQAQNSREAMQDALEVRITLYIDAHLTEPDLSASRIAHAHNISLRHLYNIWARTGHGLSLSQWIIDLRLQRAREQLASPDNVRASVATIARDCGFIDPTHFSRRFRDSFGISPRDWRAANLPPQQPWLRAASAQGSR